MNNWLIEFNLKTDTNPPTKLYTIKQQSMGEGQFIRPSSCPSRYGHVKLIIEPYNDNTQFLLDWRVAEEDIPAEFIPGVQRGIQRAAQDEEMDGAAIINVKVTIVGGSFHPVDSSSFAYEIAALKAFKQALPAAELILI